MFNPLAFMIRFSAAILTCSADGRLAFMDKHLFLADRDRNVFVMGDIQSPDGANWSISSGFGTWVMYLD